MESKTTGSASTRAKNRYKKKTYDRIELAIPKGMKDIIDKAANEAGTSRTDYIVKAINEKMNKDS